MMDKDNGNMNGSGESRQEEVRRKLLECENEVLTIEEFKERLKHRADGQSDWLKKNHPEVKRDSKYLDEGTPERAYWHSGYCVGLLDTLRLLSKVEISPPTSDKTPPKD